LTKLLDDVKNDLNFIRTHTLQPKWYKILKVVIILGFLAGYYYLFGFITTTLFFTFFIFLSIIVHITYRIKTNIWTQSWLDFVVVNENNENKTKSIGKFYYSAIILNTILSVVLSQILT
jgi:hypothetical protein